MKKDKPVSTKVQYWFNVTERAYIMTVCADWFGRELTPGDATTVLGLLSLYPDETQDGAIETCLFIFFAKLK